MTNYKKVKVQATVILAVESDQDLPLDEEVALRTEMRLNALGPLEWCKVPMKVAPRFHFGKITSSSQRD